LCWSSILPLARPLCDACGDPESPVRLAAAAGSYEGALRAVLHAIKYDARRSLAAPLGALMRVRGSDVLRGATCVVPVPLHRARHRQRGFNQASDLARHLGLPVVHALVRVRATVPQTELSADERRRNLAGAFAPSRHARRLIGSAVVLVDDVSTTGTTLEECAITLRTAGIRDVRALTAAVVVEAASGGAFRQFRAPEDLRP
jgi:ComF family protein